MRKYWSPTSIVPLIGFLVIFGVVHAFALDPHKSIGQYGRNNWSRQNGLPSNAVNVIVQSHDGYLWLGTTAGLFRFDGARFNRVSTDPVNEQNRETVTALCESRDGSMWIGTANNWLSRLKDGKLMRYAETQGVGSRNINSLFENRAGEVWIGTSFGLYKFNGDKIVSIPIDPMYVTGIAQDSSGRMWVGTYAGVRIFDGLGPARTLRVQTPSNNQSITTIYADRQNSMWIGTFDGLIRWRADGVTAFTKTDGLSDSYITSIRQDRDGNLWVGTNNGGINRFTHGRWTSFTSNNDFSNNNVLSIAEDREGSLWVCTSNGLNQFRDVNITSYTTDEGLIDNDISSVIELPDGAMYFLSKQAAPAARMKNGILSRTNIPSGPAYVARDGSLWIAQSGVLYHMQHDGVIRYDAKNGIPAKWISAITEDSASVIFYSDRNGLLRLMNGHAEPYLLKNGKRYASLTYVACFYAQHPDILWIGTTGGLMKIQNGVVTRYSAANGLAGNWVSSIYDDLHGGLWISSPQAGLTLYKGGKFLVYNTKVGLFTDEIYCVLGDTQGDLWLSTPRGIGRIRHNELDDFEAGRSASIRAHVFTTADGMKTEECFGEWQPAGWKASDGSIWFATRKGAVKIDNKKFTRNTLAPPVLIEQVIVDQESLPVNKSVDLEPGKEKFEFHYTALSILVPERVNFKYQLEGYDREFINAGTRRVAYYTNLPPGTYRFHVMACNNDGVWNEAGQSFVFELKPHFYQTAWFYALVFIALTGMIAGGYRLRVWQLLRRERELRVRIQEATANIKTLGGLIPICSNCKKIRNDKGYWDQVEGYIQQHSETTFSHDICPDCTQKLAAGLGSAVSEKAGAKHE
jgi:ligand-binding sensor domain-containing protein